MKEQKQEQENDNEPVKQKICFVVMPIADMDGYDKGHFDRVYKHLIIPSCKMAGYKAVRADDVIKSNYIVADIVKKIVESDMVICDLSGRNPNVMFELGFRQAFNLPTVLIKDEKTPNIFDIQGLRFIPYEHNLRIDCVENEVPVLANAIKSTSEVDDGDIMSLVQMLAIKPATIPNDIPISNETNLILSTLSDIKNSLANVEFNKRPLSEISKKYDKNSFRISKRIDGFYSINGYKASIGDELFLDGDPIGELVSVNPEYIIVKDGEDIERYDIGDAMFSAISTIPF